MYGLVAVSDLPYAEISRAIPAGTLLDDVYWPLTVALAGHRVVHDERALAYDRLPERAADEFRRKVRTLAGNLQLAARLPTALLPWRNPVWVQFLSHKLARLVVPWAMLGLLASNVFLLDSSGYAAAFAAQAFIAWTRCNLTCRLLDRLGLFICIDEAKEAHHFIEC